METPFHIDILGLEEGLMVSGSHSHVVSLNDPGYQGPFPQPRAGGKICRLHFDDATPVESKWAAEPILATPADLALILEFTRELSPDDRLLVHCYAGVSRATATASAILHQHGVPLDTLKSLVRKLRPISYPNVYMLSMYDELLDCGGELVALREDWVPDWLRDERRAAEADS